MELEQILTLVTFFTSLIMGMIAKKSKWFNDNLIPVQNICIGLIVAIIEYVITKDFSTAILLSGLTAGGTWDVAHNLEKIVKKGE